MLDYYSALILGNRSKRSRHGGHAGIWHGLALDSCERDVGKKGETNDPTMMDCLWSSQEQLWKFKVHLMKYLGIYIFSF